MPHMSRQDDNQTFKEGRKVFIVIYTPKVSQNCCTQDILTNDLLLPVLFCDENNNLTNDALSQAKHPELWLR